MIRDESHKYIRFRKDEGVYFDLETDPEELDGRSTVAFGRPLVLRRELEMALEGQVSARERNEDPEVLQQLKQLGYVDSP